MNDIDIFLDSGAFSMMSRGVEIDIEEYIEFVQTYKKYLSVYANLDVINDPIATMKNQKIMEEHGLEPLPTYHADTPIKYLYKLLDKYEYIAIGGTVGKSTDERIIIYDRVFDIITSKNGEPSCKIHGFGITTPDLMLRYPFYSVDSTSWIKSAMYGNILVPRWDLHKNDWDYFKNYVVYVGSNTDDNYHIAKYSKNLIRYILDYLEFMGMSLNDVVDTATRITSNRLNRALLNIATYEGIKNQKNAMANVFDKKIRLNKIF